LIAGNSVSQPEEPYGFEMLAKGSTYDVDILPPPRVIGFEAVDRFPIAWFRKSNYPEGCYY